jgi:hypothetical protein
MPGVPLPAVTTTTVSEDDAPAEEQHYRHQLVAYLSRADNWSLYTGSDHSNWAPQRGSTLAADNARTDPYQLSHSAKRAITGAVSHLDGLRVMVLGPQGKDHDGLYLPTHAAMTLLRATMENAATAIWLLAPPDSDERAVHAFQLGAAEVRNSEAARKLTRSVGPRTKDERLDRIRGLARALGLDPKAATGRTDYADIMRAGAAYLGVNGDAAEAMWRACSGLAHGDPWPLINVLDNTEVARTATGVTKEITANTKILAFAAGMSVDLIDGALRGVSVRNVSPAANEGDRPGHGCPSGDWLG